MTADATTPWAGPQNAYAGAQNVAGATKDMPLMLRIGDSLRNAEETVNRIVGNTVQAHERVFGSPSWPPSNPRAGVEPSCAQEQIDGLLSALHEKLLTLESLTTQLTTRL